MTKTKTYLPTRKGYGELLNDDSILALACRDVAMGYLPQHYRIDTMDKRIEGYNHLINVANLSGFKIRLSSSIVDNIVVLNNNYPLYRNQHFYRNLFKYFKQEIENVEYDPNDEHGLCDETVKIANISNKYRDIISLKVKKKSFLEKVLLFITNNYNKI